MGKIKLESARKNLVCVIGLGELLGQSELK
jgi:hypothetical protein